MRKVKRWECRKINWRNGKCCYIVKWEAKNVTTSFKKKKKRRDEN